MYVQATHEELGAATVPSLSMRTRTRNTPKIIKNAENLHNMVAHVYTYSIGSTGAPHCPALGTNDAFSFGALVRLFSIRWLEDHHFGFTKTVTVQKD